MKNLLFVTFCLSLLACSSNDIKPTTEPASPSGTGAQPLQLNITVLLDLSDRIDPGKYPETPQHFERDISNIRYLAQLFVKDMEKRGTFMAKGKFRIIFSPKPDDPNVNNFAKNLSVDLSTFLLPENISKYSLRKNANWREEISKKDFGLITVRHDLDKLEVLVLEVTPSRSYKNDEDIIKEVLKKWFDEMKIKRAAIYNSELPEQVKRRIDDFMG